MDEQDPPYTFGDASDHTISQYRSLEEIPEKFRSLFSDYPCLNLIQSKVLDDIMHSDRSLVVSAPTGSGKTVIFELSIVKLLIERMKMDEDRDFKIIYIAPVKALCTEKCNDWLPKFAKFGLSCVEVTGDSGDYFDLQGYNLILTTPEKWDSLTRKWRDNMSLVQMVKLFLVDEVHLLNDSTRGPVLETIICRMKTVMSTLKCAGHENALRFVAVSATIYNIEDIAVWLGSENEPACFYRFGNELRPVKLNRVIKGYDCPPNQNAFFFDLQLSYKLKPLLMEYAEGKPSLIFCSTRKSVIQTAQILAQQVSFHLTESQYDQLYGATCNMTDNKAKSLVLSGIGYHHAGMSADDRHVIQELFASGFLPILVATSTLAMGVNLPAHLVIIKSTSQFCSGKVVEYSETSILQMIGRAGRPQFDQDATAVIMTKRHMVPKYERMLDSKEVLESHLLSHLTEHLNSEIVLYTITDISVAMEWIRSTFLYIRAMKNPVHYGFQQGSKIDTKLQDICLRELNGLKKCELIEFNENGIDITPTNNGRLMSHFYLSFETFKIFLQSKGTETVAEILTALCEAQEFSEVRLRVNERRILNDLNRNKQRECVRFPLPGKIKNKSMKVNCLIQSCLGCLPIQDHSLHQEAYRIVKAAERIAKCLCEFLSRKPHYQSALSACILSKCLHAKLWEDSPFVSRQLEKIGPSLGSLLSASGKTTFRLIEASNPRDLELILNRPPPLGNILQNAVYHLPKYDMKIDITEKDSDTVLVETTISLLNADVLEGGSTAGEHHWLSLIIGDSENNILGYHRISDMNLIRNDVFKTECNLRLFALPQCIYANLISDQWVGLDVKHKVDLLPQTVVPLERPIRAPKTKRSKSYATQTPKKAKTKSNCITAFLAQFAHKNLNKTDTEKVQENFERALSQVDSEDSGRLRVMDETYLKTESPSQNVEEKNTFHSLLSVSINRQKTSNTVIPKINFSLIDEDNYNKKQLNDKKTTTLLKQVPFEDDDYFDKILQMARESKVKGSQYKQEDFVRMSTQSSCDPEKLQKNCSDLERVFIEQETEKSPYFAVPSNINPFSNSQALSGLNTPPYFKTPCTNSTPGKPFTQTCSQYGNFDLDPFEDDKENFPQYSYDNISKNENKGSYKDTYKQGELSTLSSYHSSSLNTRSISVTSFNVLPGENDRVRFLGSSQNTKRDNSDESEENSFDLNIFLSKVLK